MPRRSRRRIGAALPPHTVSAVSGTASTKTPELVVSLEGSDPLCDPVANAAFYYGLVRSLTEAQRPIWTQMSFTTAAENLHEAARHGLDAHLYWPGVGDTGIWRLLPLQQ